MAIDWEGVRKDYLKGKISVRGLAGRYGCHPATIRKRAKKEGWTQVAKKDVPEAKRGCKNQGDITCLHRHLWKGVKKKLIRGLESRDLKTGLEELKVAKVAGEVLTSVIKGERQAWGLDDNDGERLPEDAGEIVQEMASLTVPSGAGKAMDGE